MELAGLKSKQGPRDAISVQFGMTRPSNDTEATHGCDETLAPQGREEGKDGGKRRGKGTVARKTIMKC